MNKKLEVKNLQISFRTQAGILKAVRNISFDLYEGETFAIVGESGSGKSVTSKAIMGILSGNSIVEGGEIYYDGQDLLKITEEDFHKIRGDKIAMIFQDPMSSLNPIMRIGQQLTEAMILKAKTSKKNARKAFNKMLATLQKNIDIANANNPNYQQEETAKKIKTFDDFCIESTNLERIYNAAVASATDLDVELENAIIYLQKNRKFDYIKSLKKVKKAFKEALNPYVVLADEEYTRLDSDITSLLADAKHLDLKKVEEVYVKIREIINVALHKEQPNFFRIGYYRLMNPEADITSMDIHELNEMTLNYLNENFMNDFIEMAKKGVEYSYYYSIQAKKIALNKIDETITFFTTINDNLTENEAYKVCKETDYIIKDAINHLEVKKNSLEYVFGISLRSAIRAYFDGIIQNPIEEKKYQNRLAKYQKLIDSGKTPDWTLKPQIIVDIKLKYNNILKVLSNMKESLTNDLNQVKDFNSHDKVVELIDFFKEQASKVVVKMNKKIAKAKAIKLLEEVGIPDPTIRFHQYPFEFSGGMRQRIVIAIALSANPDILICDEPTTALDVTIQSQILELINKIKEERHLSVIFITHNLGVVANMADRIGVMYAGKIVEYGTAEEIFYEPCHPYTWALLSSMPDLHTKDRLESIPGTPPNMIYPPKGDAFAARNKYALEIDYELEPPLFEVSKTHFAATWLLHPNAPKVEMPKIIRDRIERMKKEMAENGQ